MDNKSELRREVRRRIKNLSADDKFEASVKIFQRVELLDAFTKSRCIAVYAAMSDEVPTAATLLRWSAMRKRVVLPKVEGDVMRFYDFDPQNMEVGAFGIDEPVAGCECPPSDIDMIIVPARAFTHAGVRLGRGGGFYDKYMSLPDMHAYKCGVAFSCQLFDELPADEHDIAVDVVVAD